MDHYFVSYASLEQQRWMVSDESRTTAFAHAIAEAVKPGDVVIDVGAGTGVLSLLAAKAGARRVIAVERSSMAEHARRLIAHNNLQDRIEVFEGDAHDLVLDEKADLIVSEWIGHMAYVENMFDVVMAVRDAHLKTGGIMLPSAVDVMLAPTDAGDLFYEHGPGYWEKDVHGIDFSCFVKSELEQGFSKKLELSDELLLADGKSLHHLETVPAQPGDEWGNGTVEFTIERDGVLNGFMGWFSSLLSPSVVLDTAPSAPRTHWEQTFFPFHPIDVVADQKVSVEYRMDSPWDHSRLMELTLEVGEHKIRFLVD